MIDAAETVDSIRRKCSVLGIRRATYYKRKKGHRPEQKDLEVVEQLQKVTNKYIAWGFWMVFHFLRAQGFKWNHKKVYRIWKSEHLHIRVIRKRPKLKRKFLDLIAPEQINEGWAMDFLSDWIVGHKEQKVRIINIMDECSRRALWTEAHYNISAKTLTDILDKVVQWRGKPSYIRCDNGPEFISKKLSDWADKNRVDIRFTQPGKPTQNGLIERLNGTLRKECLNLEWFESIEQLNIKVQQWWNTYNNIRPHSSIGYKTPLQMETINQSLYFKVVAA